MSILIDPTTPADADSPRQGAAKIRALTLQLLQLLSQGGGAPVTFAAAPFTVDASGNVTASTTLTVPTPSAVGQATPKTYVDQLGPWSGTAAGTNTYTVNLADPNGVAPLTLAQLVGQPLTVQFTNANTGAATLNANGFGAKAIQAGGAALTSGQLQSNLYVHLVYDGTQFELIQGGGGTIAAKGSYTFPGGLILKWNAVTAPANPGTATDTFTVAFPNNLFAAVSGGTSAGNNATFISAVSTTSITVGFAAGNGGPIYYFALGN